MLGFQIKFKVWPPASLACDIKENKKRKKIQITYPQDVYRKIKPVITFLGPLSHTMQPAMA